MKTIRIPRGVYCCLAFLLACLISGSPLPAQSPSLTERLSPNTVFFLVWNGHASYAGSEQKNHLLQLLHDPAFASMWTAATNKVQQGTPNAAGAAGASLAPDIISALDNPFVFGVVIDPDAPKTAAPGVSTSPFAAFGIYDETGKADVVEKLEAQSRAGSKTTVEVTKYDFSGASIEVRTAGKQVSYRAHAGNYYLMADRKQVIEDLVTRFRSADRPATSIAQSAEYDRMHKYVGADAALEIFGRIPDSSTWNLSEKNAKQIMQLAKSLHLEKIHVMAGALNFEGEATRFRGAVLGDTSPTGLFDVAGASGATFQTQPVIATAPVFSITHMNLAALYQLIRDAVNDSAPSGSNPNLAMVEAGAQNFLGMSITDALSLFPGEIASASFYSADGVPEQLYAATIEKPDAVLRVLRALVGTMISNEDTSGSATYLDLAYPYTDPATGAKRRRFYYVAVTPKVIVAAPRKAMLREALQRLDAGAADPPATGVLADPQYAQLRSRLPEKLSGLTGASISGIPLDSILKNIESQAAPAANPSNGQKPPDLSWLRLDVISRYLHITLSGWWKDSNGVYFDSYIQ